MIVPLLALFLQLTPPPPQMNWYWLDTFSTNDLSKKPGTGAAFLAASYYLTGAKPVESNPRVMPLKLPPKTFRMAVVRVNLYAAKFTPAQSEELARMIAEVPALTRTQALQIDFDAPESAWPFYRALVGDVRQRVGPNVFFSITALASWCGAKSWMKDLPVDEIVPMFFRQGRQRIEPPLAFPACQSSAGVSDDEPPVRLPATIKRVYTFKTNRSR
ncbi:MAG: hypothetical protein ABI972_09480 [Acidobacteriota bacterium]